jgi:6-phosphogluconolactonase (cycloisomerase 2 family)
MTRRPLHRSSRYGADVWIGCALLSLLSACGDDTGNSGAGRVVYLVSGTISNATISTSTVTLVLNGAADPVQISAAQGAQSWTHPMGLSDGQSYTLSVQSPQHETCTIASNSSTSSTSASISGVIAGQNVMGLSVKCNPTTYVVSASVNGPPGYTNYNIVLHLTSSSAEFGTTSDSKLPIAADTAAAVPINTAVDDGSSYEVTIEEPTVSNTAACPNQTTSKPLRPVNCLIANPSSGVINGGAVTAQVQCVPVGRFLYAVADDQTNITPPEPGAVVPFKINPTTGLLTQNGSTAVTDVNPGPLALAPKTTATDPNCPVPGSSAFAYVPNNGIDQLGAADISQYTIDNLEGTITPLTPATVPLSPLGTEPWKLPVAFDPTGGHVYVTAAVSQQQTPVVLGNTISSYAIGSGGALVSDTTYTVGHEAWGSLVFSPDGSYAYQVNNTGFGCPPNKLPDCGPYIAAYSVNASTGALTEIPQSPILVPIIEPEYLTFAPNGKFAYLLNYTSCLFSAGNKACSSNSPPGVLAYEFDSANPGNLKLINGANGSIITVSDVGVSGAADTYSPVVIDQSGTYAFVLNHVASSISVYQINSDGTLCSAVGSPFQPGGYTSVPSSMVIDPSGRFAYVLFSITSTIAAYSINLSAFVPNLSATSNCQSSASAASAQASGVPALALIGIYPTGANTGAGVMQIEPSGRFLFISNTGNLSVISGTPATINLSASVGTFFIDPNTGALTPALGSPFTPTTMGITSFDAITVMP